MKEKTSVTLSAEALSEIDRMAGSKSSRSAVIDDVFRQRRRDRIRAERGARDLAILNKFADELNAEAEDVLCYQAPEDSLERP
jgi:metal-responsive CopG/Arc/MetJ family transcriptional regulator